MRTSASARTPARTLDEPEGASNESGIHHRANQGRDFKTESGIASTGRREDEGQGTAENISSRQEKNRGSTEKKVGEGQGREEVRQSRES
jgi:hypothetical protein